MDEHDMHVPFDQIVYAGDGLSDLNAFAFVTNNGGFAVAIDKDERFDHADEQTPDERVENLARPDFSEGSEVLETLMHGVRSATSRIAARALGEGE